MIFMETDDGYVMVSRHGGVWFIIGGDGEWRPCDSALDRIESGEADELTEEQGRNRVAELGGRLDDLPA